MTTQIDAYVELLRSLNEADWSLPTDCTLWDVRMMAAHVAGALEEGARMSVMVRHIRTARRTSPPMAMVDALNAAQVSDRRERSGPAIADDIERLTPMAVHKRLRMPTLVRRFKVPGDDLPAGSTLGYLFDVIYARDVWLHRVDTARATKQPVKPVASDEEVVAQVIRDLARFWQGPPFVLALDGIGAGRWLIGSGAPTATVLAETGSLLRLLSGRAGDVELDVTGDTAIADLVRAARVAF